MIHVIGHSAIWHGNPSYAELLNAHRVESAHKYLHTILGALHEIKQLNPTRNDTVILHLGINDCIYRKDRLIQFAIIKGLSANTKQSDPESSQYFLEKAVQFINKDEDTLIQLFSFKQFHDYAQVLLQWQTNLIVIGSAWYPKNHPIIGYAFKETRETNRILKQLCILYDLPYIDLWQPPDQTTDGVHFSESLHHKVANIIKWNLHGTNRLRTINQQVSIGKTC